MSTSESSDEDFILLYELLRRRRKRRRKRSKSHWTSEIFLKRESLGEFHQLVPSLWEDEDMFRDYFRMSIETYKYLVVKAKPLVEIGSTNFRKSISFEEKLTVTLRFLATGDSYMSASRRFRIAHNTISRFVPYMCDAIYSALQPEFLAFPNKEDWTKICKKFEDNKQFPNCVGALDGRHVRLKRPDNNGSYYFYNNMYTSIVFMALVSADLRFTMINIGFYVKNNDGGVFANSVFGKKMLNQELDLPDDKPLHDGGDPMPHVVVANEAFRLLPNLMKPYPKRGITRDRQNFNSHLLRARSSVDCAFGLLASKFQIFHFPISVKPENVDKLIKAACALHNFILVREGRSEEEFPAPEAFVALTNEVDNAEVNVNASSRHAREIRDRFKEYFFRDSVLQGHSEAV